MLLLIVLLGKSKKKIYSFLCPIWTTITVNGDFSVRDIHITFSVLMFSSDFHLYCCASHELYEYRFKPAITKW